MALGLLFGPSAYAAASTKSPNCAYNLEGPALAVDGEALVFIHADCAEEIWDSMVLSDAPPLRSLVLWNAILKSKVIPGDGFTIPALNEYSSRAQVLATMLLWDRMIQAHQQAGRPVNVAGGAADWQRALGIYGTTPDEIALLPMKTQG